MLQRIQIERSVGEMARNDMADVRKVQERLNELLDPNRPQLVPDGINGPNTKNLIGEFQKKVVGLANPDRRVDPVGRTISALNDIASREKWKHDPDGPGTWEPDRPEPGKFIDFDKLPKIPVIGPLDHNGGFDSFPPPAQVLGPTEVEARVERDGAWIMLPIGSKRQVRLDINADAPVQIFNNGIDENGFVSSFKSEQLLRATFRGNCLVLEGLASCKTCQLDIVQNGRHLRIYVSVKPVRMIPLFAFHVQHGPGMKSRISSSELNSIIQIANTEILQPQCNVKLELKDERDLTHKDIAQHLGTTFIDNRNDPEQDELRLFEPFAIERTFPQPHGAEPSKTVNVFIVREMKIASIGEKKPRRVMGVMRSSGRQAALCVIDDQSIGRITKVKPVATILAHEIGHMLIGSIYTHGKNSIVSPRVHNPFKDALMYHGPVGTKLYRAEIEAMNPTKHQPLPVIL